MSAPPLKQPVLTCRRKHRHADEMAARASAMFCISAFGNVNRLWVYPCPECRGWHLTKRDKGIRWMVTSDNPVHERIAA